MGGVGRVILDDSILLGCDDENGVARLQSGAEYVLSKLSYSTISTGIFCDSSLSTHKVDLLKKVAKLYSCSSFIVTVFLTGFTPGEGDIVLDVAQDKGRVLYVVSSRKKDIFDSVQKRGWMVAVLREVEEDWLNEDPNLIFVDQLEALPLAICKLNKEWLIWDEGFVGDKMHNNMIYMLCHKQTTRDNALLVAIIMKQSREEDFAKQRGALPMSVSENGLIFMPLTPSLPISTQLKEVDIILHKATDEIVSIEMCSSSTFFNKITYTPCMLEVERYLQNKLEVCVVDPLKNIYPVLDRLWTQEILLSLEDLKFGSDSKIRGPRFLKVDNFTEIAQKLVDAKLTFPAFVKPQIACGVAEAHKMAIVFKVEDYANLNIPVPAIIQEYVDHSSYIFKVYVLGKKIFYATRRSIPSAGALMSFYGESGPFIFDSLKGLPFGIQLEPVVSPYIDLDQVTNAANWLQKKLDLTIFGFDVLIEEGSRDHVIVDINYLPSFKEVPDAAAVSAFWDAIRTRYEVAKEKHPMPHCSL